MTIKTSRKQWHCFTAWTGGKNSTIVFFFFFGQGVQINRREIICRHHREHLPSAQTPPAAPGKGVVTVHRSAHRSAATRRSSILSRDDGALGGRGRFFQDRGTPWRPAAWPSKREELHLRNQEIPGLVRLLRLHYLCIKHNGTCRNFIANLEANKQTTKKNNPTSFQFADLSIIQRRETPAEIDVEDVEGSEGEGRKHEPGAGEGGGEEPVRRFLNQVTCESRRWFGFTVVCF